MAIVKQLISLAVCLGVILVPISGESASEKRDASANLPATMGKGDGECYC